MANLDHLGNPNLPGYLKTTQPLTAGTASSTQSSAFTANTNCIRIWSDSTVFIALGENPTAAQTIGGGTTKIPANFPIEYAVFPGSKVAARTATGTANIAIEEY